MSSLISEVSVDPFLSLTLGPSIAVRTVVIDSGVAEMIASLVLSRQLSHSALGRGSVALILRDPDITAIGKDLAFAQQMQGTFYGTRSLLSVDLSGVPSLARLGDYVFSCCSALEVRRRRRKKEGNSF